MRLTLALMLVLCAAGARADQPAPFFNGRDLAGWEGLTEYWSVKDGAIVGSAPKGIKFNTFLCSKRRYRDFELSFQVRLNPATGNSGVQIRSRIRDSKQDQEHFAVEGPQCDMALGYWGSLFGEHFSGPKPGDHRMMQAAPKEVVDRVLKKDDFNDYFIRCVGKRVTIKLNGATTVDADFPVIPDEGIIAWQLHSGGPLEVTFRRIKFQELRK